MSRNHGITIDSLLCRLMFYMGASVASIEDWCEVCMQATSVPVLKLNYAENGIT